MLHSLPSLSALARPPSGPADFWRAMDEARAALCRGPADGAALVAGLAARIGDDPALMPGRRAALRGFCRVWGLADPPAPPHVRLGLPPLSPRRIADLAKGGEPGISIITCCRNRNANLVRALPSWLALPVDEVVVVDWTSDTPVADSLAEAGLADDRLVVARVRDEPRWILSQAFNLGFRLARCATILKADADIVLSPDFLARNPLPCGGFVAGNWRTAGPGQQFVNGFFLIRRTDLAAVNGFNEYITAYGWDDDDLYQRLAAAGLTRRDVTAETVRHLDHDDAARLGEAPAFVTPGAPSPLCLTRTNRLIATIMPVWDGNRALSAFDLTQDGDGPVLTRATPPLAVPAHVQETAARLAAADMLSWRLGPAVFDLPPEAFDRLTASVTAEAITPLHLAHAAAGADAPTLAARHFLLADVEDPPGDAPRDAKDLADLAHRVAALAPGRQAVLRVPPDRLGQIAATSPLPVLTLGPPPPGTRTLRASAVAGEGETPVLRIEIGRDTALPAPILGPVPGSAFRPAARRLYVDVQHGLGNRLRAIASAGAIARATDRELVVIWTPDHHCRARLADLFDWPGIVLEGVAPAEAAGAGVTVLNYMEAESGSAKGAPLTLDPGRDALVRTAYVINHPASTWAAENLTLRALTPAAGVRELLHGFPRAFDIGLHVRMEGAPGHVLASYDRPENWTPEGHAAIQHWREASHPERFIARLRQHLAQRPGLRCFLAADRPETYAEFARQFGPQVATLPRRDFDRSVAQLRHALADMLLLSRAGHLIRSNWSSFSEVALRLAAPASTQEVAGLDF